MIALASFPTAAWLAAIRTAPATPTPTPMPEVPMRDAEGVVEIPMALWLQIGLWAFGLGLAGLLAWALYRWWRSRPGAPVLTPRQQALGELEQLRQTVRSTDPQEFSFRVSEVLRRYVEGEYRLRALEQTSEEFLAALSLHPRLGESDHALLRTFLQRSDMIKFARQGADYEASEELLSSAFSFVQGGRA